MTDVSEYCVNLYGSARRKSAVRFDPFDATMLKKNRSMFQYESSLEFVKDEVQSSAFNVYDFELQGLRVYEMFGCCENTKLPIARDNAIAIKVENTVKALGIVRKTIDDRAARLKLSDAFTSDLNLEILCSIPELEGMVSDELFRQYLVRELQADKLMTQKSMTKQIYRHLNSDERVYYGVLFSPDQEELPMLSFLYKLKTHPPSGAWYMELSYWTRSFLYDYVHLSKTQTPRRQSIGPMALSLIVDSANAIGGEPIAFINVEALYGTQLVLQRMREGGLKFVVSKGASGLKEQHVIVNNPDFSTYWKRFATKRRKTACIQCGLCEAQLYRGKENLVFCGDACHQEYFNICSTPPCL